MATIMMTKAPRNHMFMYNIVPNALIFTYVYYVWMCDVCVCVYVSICACDAMSLVSSGRSVGKNFIIN